MEIVCPACGRYKRTYPGVIGARVDASGDRAAGNVLRRREGRCAGSKGRRAEARCGRERAPSRARGAGCRCGERDGARLTVGRGWQHQRPAHQRGVTLRAACGGQRAREAREIGLPVDRRGRLDRGLRVQRAGGIELFGAGMRVQSVVAHGMAPGLGGVREHAGEKVRRGQSARVALRLGSPASLCGV